MGNCADLIQVGLRGQSRPDLSLRHQENLLVLLHGALKGADGDRPLHIEVDGHVGKDSQSPQGQHRDVHSSMAGKISFHFRMEKGRRKRRLFSQEAEAFLGFPETDFPELSFTA